MSRALHDLRTEEPGLPTARTVALFGVRITRLQFVVDEILPDMGLSTKAIHPVVLSTFRSSKG